MGNSLHDIVIVYSMQAISHCMIRFDSISWWQNSDFDRIAGNEISKMNDFPECAEWMFYANSELNENSIQDDGKSITEKVNITSNTNFRTEKQNLL